MASNGGMPVVKGKGGKVLGTLVFLAVVFLVISQPTESAQFVVQLIGWFKDAARGLATFFRSLASAAT